MPANNIRSSKKHEKTLGKRLLPEPNRSWRPIPGGRNFQNHNIGQQSEAIPLWSPKNDVLCNGKLLSVA